MKKQSEAGFAATVLQLAKLHGWKSLHIRPARTTKGWRTPIQGDGKGWPDLFLVRGSVIIAAELKVGKGIPTDEQSEWLRVLARAGVLTFIWNPEDWDDIRLILDSAGI